jgi:hypothetical protein
MQLHEASCRLTLHADGEAIVAMANSSENLLKFAMLFLGSSQQASFIL